MPFPIILPENLGLLTLQVPLPHPLGPRSPLTVVFWVLVATVLALQGTRCRMMVAVVLRWGMEGPASATRISSS